MKITLNLRMSGSGTETLVGCEAAPGSGCGKKDSLGFVGSPAYLIIKDLWRNSFKAVRSQTSYLRSNPLFCESI